MTKLNRSISSILSAALCSAVVTPAVLAESRSDSALRQPLADALREYGQRYGQQIIFTEDSVAGLTTASLRGELKAGADLNQLFAGTGLVAEQSPSGVWMTRRLPYIQSNPQTTDNSFRVMQVALQAVEPPRPAATTATQAPAESASPAATAPQPEAQALEEIVITGSRITRSGFTAPTPTTILSAEDMQARGAGNIAEIINEVPSFRPSQTPAAASRGFSGGNFVDLRGLNSQGLPGTQPTTRTLVLVNGRRFVGSNLLGTGAVDLNLIPSSLVERTEIVTGGASAAWGSDAIAGVVNLILKDKLQGIQSNIAYGQSEQGDNEEQQISFGAGTSFADDRGHVIFGAEYVNNEGIPDASVSRDWGRQGYGLLAFPGGPRPAGVPSRVVAPDVRLSDRMAPGGVIVGGPLDNITFLGGQSIGIFVPGAIVAGNQMIGGGSNPGIFFGGGSNLVNPIERYALLGRASFDFNDALGVWAEASRGGSNFNGLSASRRDDATLIIRNDNAYLPLAVRNLMITNGNLQTITVGRVAFDQNYGFYKQKTDQTADRVAFGAKGALGGDWAWDAYYQWGQSDVLIRNEATINSNYLAAIDAVEVAPGDIRCRTGTANFNAADPGCVPFNIFGQNSPSQAAVDYVRDYYTNDVKLRQDAAAVNFNGTLFDNWAGPVAVATGVEYRKEKASNQVDANSVANRFDLGNPKPLRGKYNTKELYGEVAFPLLKDQPFAQALELNAAARLTDYSTSGSVDTWKLGLSYNPINDVRLRATQSRDIRAPNIGELYATSIVNRAPIRGVQVDQITSGNPNLVPEEADTFTAGIVYQPDFLRGFRASLDYYNIQIDGVITSLSALQTIEACERGNADLCNKISPPGVPGNTVILTPSTRVNVTQANFNSLKTNGVDLELAYEFDLGPGRFGARALATYVDELTIAGQFVTNGKVNYVRQSLPQLSGNLRFSYDIGRVDLSAQFRYAGPTVVDKTFIGPDSPNYSPSLPNSINDNTRPSVVYVNLSGQYRLIEGDGLQVQVYGVVNNLFDKDPPLLGANVPAGASPYDVVGRAYKLGVRVNL